MSPNKILYIVNYSDFDKTNFYINDKMVNNNILLDFSKIKNLKQLNNKIKTILTFQ